jgi:hypothetical protein
MNHTRNTEKMLKCRLPVWWVDWVVFIKAGVGIGVSMFQRHCEEVRRSNNVSGIGGFEESLVPGSGLWNQLKYLWSWNLGLCTRILGVNGFRVIGLIIPYTLCLKPYTLYLTPYILHLTSYTLILIPSKKFLSIIPLARQSFIYQPFMVNCVSSV